MKKGDYRVDCPGKNTIQGILCSGLSSVGEKIGYPFSIESVVNSDKKSQGPVVVLHKQNDSATQRAKEHQNVSLPVPFFMNIPKTETTAMRTSSQIPQQLPQKSLVLPELQKNGTSVLKIDSILSTQNQQTTTAQLNFYQCQNPQIYVHNPNQMNMPFVQQQQQQKIQIPSIKKIYSTAKQIPQINPYPVQIKQQQQQQNAQMQQQMMKMQIQQQMQQQQRNPIPSPVVTLPKVNQHVVDAPEPSFFNDKVTGKYGIRCVCGESRNDVTLIQCDLCEFWLHARCVNIARVSDNESYYCPFCRGQRIQCSCGDQKNYSESIVQCSICKFWVHKQCENLDYGFIPNDFICSRCQQNKSFQIPFNQLFPRDVGMNKDLSISNFDRNSILELLVDGNFKEMLIDDLNKTELHFCEIMAKYFQNFAPLLFDRIHEFWKCYIEIFSQLFNVDKNIVLLAIDSLANKLLYNANIKITYPPLDKFLCSEEVQASSINASIIRLEKLPPDVIIKQNNDGKLVTTEPIDDNQYIIELPGFLEFMDEVRVDKGIPYSCISITNKEYVVDVSGSRFHEAEKIKRSFHFNCVVKLIKVNGDLSAALFATRFTLPLNEKKGRRGPAIHPGQELILPLDGYIPFHYPKVEWKKKKNRMKISAISYQPPSQKPSIPNHLPSHSPPPLLPSSPLPSSSSPQPSLPLTRNKLKKKALEKGNKKKQTAKIIPLSLLSSFVYDIVPPMPFTLLSDDEITEDKNVERATRKKSKASSD